MKVYVVYSKAKIHGVYTNEDFAQTVYQSLTHKGGYLNRIPNKFYYIQVLDKEPNGVII